MEVKGLNLEYDCLPWKKIDQAQSLEKIGQYHIWP